MRIERNNSRIPEVLTSIYDKEDEVIGNIILFLNDIGTHPMTPSQKLIWEELCAELDNVRLDKEMCEMFFMYDFITRGELDEIRESVR